MQKANMPAPSSASCTDRKSTRLNSSHVEISYAVFCLKTIPPPPRSTLFPYTTLFRSVAIEFRSKQPMLWWRQMWDIGFSVGSIVSSLLIGVAMGNIAWGIPIDAKGEYAGTFFSLLHRSEEHTSELQSRRDLVCRLLLENDTPPPEIHTLSLHDALPICGHRIPKQTTDALVAANVGHWIQRRQHRFQPPDRRGNGQHRLGNSHRCKRRICRHLLQPPAQIGRAHV